MFRFPMRRVDERVPKHVDKRGRIVASTVTEEATTEILDTGPDKGELWTEVVGRFSKRKGKRKKRARMVPTFRICLLQILGVLVE